jgi:hypothetical protein
VAVTVGSAIEEVSGLAFGRIPARPFERIELRRARAVVPAALASEVRGRRRLPLVAALFVPAVLLLAARPVLPPAEPPLVLPLPLLGSPLLLLATVVPPDPSPAS